jgi:hypothetical protein
MGGVQKVDAHDIFGSKNEDGEKCITRSSICNIRRTLLGYQIKEGEMRNAKRSYGGPRHAREDINMDLKQKTGCGGVD